MTSQSRMVGRFSTRWCGANWYAWKDIRRQNI